MNAGRYDTAAAILRQEFDVERVRRREYRQRVHEVPAARPRLRDIALSLPPSPAKRRVHHEPIHFGPVNNASDGSRDEATDDPSDEQDDYCADESGQEGDDIRYALL